MPTETLRLLLSQRHVDRIRATAAAHRSPPSEQFSGLHIATYRPSDHAGSAVGLHDCLYRGAKTGNLKLREQLASGVVQPTAQQHLPGVPNLAPDPSLPDVRNGGQQQIPTSLDFSLSSLQQDRHTGRRSLPAHQLQSPFYRQPSLQQLHRCNEGLTIPLPSQAKFLGSTDGSTPLPFTRPYSSPLTHPGGRTSSPISN